MDLSNYLLSEINAETRQVETMGVNDLCVTINYLNSDDINKGFDRVEDLLKKISKGTANKFSTGLNRYR